jgi:type IV secretory pathway component VirB8
MNLLVVIGIVCLGLAAYFLTRMGITIRKLDALDAKERQLLEQNPRVQEFYKEHGMKLHDSKIFHLFYVACIGVFIAVVIFCVWVMLNV